MVIVDDGQQYVKLIHIAGSVSHFFYKPIKNILDRPLSKIIFAKKLNYEKNCIRDPIDKY